MHYKKDGTLDMRFSSSRAAASPSYSGGGYSSNYGSSSNSSSGLHYKKDGSLDMRYTSSRAAASPSYSGEGSNYGSSSNSSSGLHYKKDGTLDMRYSTSQAAASSGSNSSLTSANPIHLKKDGTPDMRFSSSKLLAQQLGTMRVSESPSLHTKKDGTLDMRFTSSKALAHQGSAQAGIPLTKTGLPDMRTAAGKKWVEQEAMRTDSIPDWLPRKKDGSLDTLKPVVAEFLKHRPGLLPLNGFDHGCRERYYQQKMDEDDEFDRLVRQERRNQDVLEIPSTPLLQETKTLRDEIISSTASSGPATKLGALSRIAHLQIKYDELKPFGNGDKIILGKGSFGEVSKEIYRGQVVAVKRLLVPQLSRKDEIAFVRELTILDTLSEHANLVKLIGFALEPPCLVMEFVQLGSLAHILHYSKDPAIEAKITSGNYKKRILVGVVAGMRQVHAVGIVHADLKPANILISQDFTPKITDFGLAYIRGKTSTSIAVVDDGEGAGGGTGAYMAPELLDSSDRPRPSSDVYSYGVLLNEVIQEEEPYSDQAINFQGRGVFGVVNYAKQGKRPSMKNKTPAALQQLIKNCWDAKPERRPTFDAIDKLLRDLKIPDSFDV